MTGVRKWFLFAEKLAGVAHIKGRAAYGLRRRSVDGAQENRASDEAIKNMFGWTDNTMISTYAEKHPQWAMQEASDVRLRVRTAGKSDPTSDPAHV